MERARDLDIEDPAQLTAYLRQAGHVAEGESPDISTLIGGVSNRVVLVRPPDGRQWVVKQALEKLRVAVEWHSSVERIHREALGLRRLETLAPPGTITPLIAEDHDRHLLIMEAVPQPHRNWKTMLLAGEVESRHVEQFATLLGSLHRHAASQPGLAVEFADRSFFESLRLEPYYGYSASQVPAAADFLNGLIADTRERRLTLVHGDYSPKNVLVHNDRLVLLDHEVIHWGDPAFDIGFALTHLLSKAHHLPDARTQFTSAGRQFWNCYRAAAADGNWQHEIEFYAVRHTLGCLLARVAGRSPLEYLTEKERARQQESVVALMHEPPATVETLIDRFIDSVS